MDFANCNKQQLWARKVCKLRLTIQQNQPNGKSQLNWNYN